MLQLFQIKKTCCVLLLWHQVTIYLTPEDVLSPKHPINSEDVLLYLCSCLQYNTTKKCKYEKELPKTPTENKLSSGCSTLQYAYKSFLIFNHFRCRGCRLQVWNSNWIRHFLLINDPQPLKYASLLNPYGARQNKMPQMKHQAQSRQWRETFHCHEKKNHHHLRRIWDLIIYTISKKLALFHIAAFEKVTPALTKPW